MSRTTAWLIRPNGEMAGVEFRNAWGFGPFVWDAVAAKYLGGTTAWMLDGSDKLWPLWSDMRLPRHWRTALLSTYDHAIIEKARFREVAAALRKFTLDVGTRERACHLPAIADLLDEHADDDLRGVCFHGTSVSEDWWHPWDSEKDEPIKYDFEAPGKHFYVGAELDKSEIPDGARVEQKSTEPRK